MDRPKADPAGASAASQTVGEGAAPSSPAIFVGETASDVSCPTCRHCSEHHRGRRPISRAFRSGNVRDERPKLFGARPRRQKGQRHDRCCPRGRVVRGCRSRAYRTRRLRPPPADPLMTENKTGPECARLRAGSISTSGCGAKESRLPSEGRSCRCRSAAARPGHRRCSPQGRALRARANPVTLTNFSGVV
jgi:hypothetical protein